MTTLPDSDSPAQGASARPRLTPTPQPLDPLLRRAAGPARLRRRHRVVMASFLVMVVLPIAVSAWYLWARAADQFASYVAFSVRTEEVGSAVELLGGITELSGSSSSDTDILYNFLSSQELVRKVDEALDLRAMWSRADPSVDFVFAYHAPGTIEDLTEYWTSMVKVQYDTSSRLLDLRVQAFDPFDAQAIAREIYAQSSQMINALSDIAREDSLRYAREELELAVERLKTARRTMTEFRNANQIVDPEANIQGQVGLITTLQNQLAEALIDLDMLTGSTNTADPRVTQAQRRIEVIQTRIAEENKKVGGGSDVAYADILGEYESLAVDRQFAEESYQAALANFDAAQAEARRQSRYIAAHVQPTLAERAEYPERGTLLALIGLFAFLAWATTVLVGYSLKDRR